jgi:metal-responsive CopG/Arc/MetJ family transcriptional regulator
MAKVMISIPDELLGRLDDHARRSGTTRSGLLQNLAEQELHTDLRRRAIRKVLATASPHGGESARLVRELRQAR